MTRKSLMPLLATLAALALPAAAQGATGSTVSVFNAGIGISGWTELQAALEENCCGGYDRFAETEEGKLRYHQITKGLTITGFHLNLPSNAIVCAECVKLSYNVRNSLSQPFWTYNIVSLVKAGVPWVSKSWLAFVGVGVGLEESEAPSIAKRWCMATWCPSFTGAEVDKPDFGVMIQPESLTEEGQGSRVYGVHNVVLEVGYTLGTSKLAKVISPH